MLTVRLLCARVLCVTCEGPGGPRTIAGPARARLSPLGVHIYYKCIVTLKTTRHLLQNPCQMSRAWSRDEDNGLSLSLLYQCGDTSRNQRLHERRVQADRRWT